MGRWRGIGRARSALVLSLVRPLLAEGEEAVAWAHVHAPDDDGHGFVVLSPSRCALRWAARDRADVVIPWDELTAWGIRDAGAGGPLLTLESRAGDVAVRLPVSTRARARRATALLRGFVALAPPHARWPAQPFGDRGLAPERERRGVRGHTRRVVVTVIGLLVILLGLLFASPIVPGPGTLTILAGLAILAREYDWAREAHAWMRRQVERLGDWRRARRRRRRAGRGAR